MFSFWSVSTESKPEIPSTAPPEARALQAEVTQDAARDWQGIDSPRQGDAQMTTESVSGSERSGSSSGSGVLVEAPDEEAGSMTHAASHSMTQEKMGDSTSYVLGQDYTNDSSSAEPKTRTAMAMNEDSTTEEGTQTEEQEPELANEDLTPALADAIDELEQEQEQQPDSSSFDGIAIDEDDIDLELVEQYDAAFNEFLAQHPDFLIRNPNLVHNLRVTKLQQLLEKQDSMEQEFLGQVDALEVHKVKVMNSYQQLLKQATQKKAAREIHLQARLSSLHQETRNLEAQLTWNLVQASMMHSKHEVEWSKVQSATISNNANFMDRIDLLALLPTQPTFDEVRAAAFAGPRFEPRGTPEMVAQYQMDNAFLNTRTQVLQKKLKYQKEAQAKQYAWVESVLQRANDETMDALKEQFQKKAGVTF